MRKGFNSDDYKTVVVKIGSNLLTANDGSLNEERIEQFSEDVSNLISDGRQVVIISSGAVAAGIGKLRIKGKPSTLPEYQAAAAAGQTTLMEKYYKAFSKFNIEVAQLLLTKDDFNDRSRYLNIRNCITHLLECNVVPIVNENDTVAVDEIKLGDNDILGAYVAMGIKADIFIILTSVEGLYDTADGDKRLVSEVSEIDENIAGMVYSEKTVMGTGGMATKIEAARMVTSAGEPMALADGRKKGILAELFSGAETGTFFHPHPSGRKISGWKRWLAFSAESAGSLKLDAGAVHAIQDRGTSLLPAGVSAIEGTFQRGELISLKSSEGEIIAKGLCNFSSDEIHKIKGKHSAEIEQILGYSSYNEVVHRDNMVVKHW